MVIPYSPIRLLFVQQEIGERIGNLITTIQEYDVEIKPTNLVRGQGLCKLVAKSQKALHGIPPKSGWENEIEMFSNEMLPFSDEHNSWYNDLKIFLHHGTCPNHLSYKAKRALKLKSSQYHLANGI